VQHDADCDGASFGGFREETWNNMSFRGLRNLDATVDAAFAHGLDSVTEFVLTGGSAGG
jgi:hypothetical protein